MNIIAIIIYQGLEDTWSEAFSNECSPKLSRSQFRLVHVTMFLSAEKAWLGVSHKKCRNEGEECSQCFILIIFVVNGKRRRKNATIPLMKKTGTIQVGARLGSKSAKVFGICSGQKNMLLSEASQI